MLLPMSSPWGSSIPCPQAAELQPPGVSPRCRTSILLPSAECRVWGSLELGARTAMIDRDLRQGDMGKPVTHPESNRASTCDL